MSLGVWKPLGQWDGVAINTAPVITVSGNRFTRVDLNGVAPTFTATATDAEDGDLTSSIVVTGDTVNTAIEGTYNIFYNVTDSDGLSANTVTRTVLVGDAIIIPVSLRASYQAIISYLKSSGFTGSSNDILSNWLLSEGFSGALNDQWRKYLEAQGFLGAFNDRYKGWSKEAEGATPWILATGTWNDSGTWDDNNLWKDV